MMKKSKILFVTLIILVAGTQYGCNKDCIKSSKCDLQPNPGSCFAIIPKYYFDNEEGECKEFIWGGCGGSVPFDTLKECEECECND